MKTYKHHVPKSLGYNGGWDGLVVPFVKYQCGYIEMRNELRLGNESEAYWIKRTGVCKKCLKIANKEDRA